MKVRALILAGGRGSRLGDVRKGDLRIGGRRLLTRVRARLGDLPILVSSGPGPAMDDDGIADIADGFGGPMAGIWAALHHLRARGGAEDVLLTVAVDTPFLPWDFAERMTGALAEGADAALAAWAGRIYPTNAAYRLAALWPLLSGPGPDSPKRLLRQLGAVDVDWSEAETDDPFANLNTLEDLIILGRRAKARDE